MTETTGSASASETKTYEEGTQVKGKDFIFLDAPAINFPENAPLHNTDKRELYSILDELFQDGGGGGDDWYPPDWWISVPEPQDYDIYALIFTTDLYGYTKRITFNFKNNGVSVGGLADFTVDWGDGTTEEYEDSSTLSHEYKSTGQFLIHIVCTPLENGYIDFYSISKSNYYNIKMLMLKTGEKIFLGWQTKTSTTATNTAIVGNDNTIFYVKINSLNGFVDVETGKPLSSFFSYAENLRKVDMDFTTGIISDSAFSGCINLDCKNILPNVIDIGTSAFYYCNIKKADMPKVKTIKQNAFNSCKLLHEVNAPNCEQVQNSAFSQNVSLETVYMPNCTYVGDYAFQNCYNLHTVVLAENCTFGNNCFQGCLSLYPRPDGSTT